MANIQAKAATIVVASNLHLSGVEKEMSTASATAQVDQHWRHYKGEYGGGCPNHIRSATLAPYLTPSKGESRFHK
ncbi:predicted protein [Sclerotinia sclerotiorum 1980 UF-70]|uniref:Uncharacterized protein n=2 Tax=Sclerotinia sclerotiorum (strain ATCC 18683 / 1980 / Ss-1) TaxID=665079 RepID=A7ERW0_SCLS1|nr:predicted protein [Sclerotinia sclerotiorum 1980 UF-70]APA13350.1 hypothetical protein sscle_11g081200 [Sclerotinia sclerotiorum 1980 UF-70]EDN92202.1 predicted protein [Sclerotinia sclerotiorum 1980 UF-70]